MRRPERSCNTIVEMKTQERSYKLHIQALHKAKAIVNTSAPEPNPHAELSRKLATKERKHAARLSEKLSATIPQRFDVDLYPGKKSKLQEADDAKAFHFDKPPSPERSVRDMTIKPNWIQEIRNTVRGIPSQSPRRPVPSIPQIDADIDEMFPDPSSDDETFDIDTIPPEIQQKVKERGIWPESEGEDEFSKTVLGRRVQERIDRMKAVKKKPVERKVTLDESADRRRTDQHFKKFNSRYHRDDLPRRTLQIHQGMTVVDSPPRASAVLTSRRHELVIGESTSHVIVQDAESDEDDVEALKIDIRSTLSRIIGEPEQLPSIHTARVALDVACEEEEEEVTNDAFALPLPSITKLGTSRRHVEQPEMRLFRIPFSDSGINDTGKTEEQAEDGNENQAEEVTETQLIDDAEPEKLDTMIEKVIPSEPCVAEKQEAESEIVLDVSNENALSATMSEGMSESRGKSTRRKHKKKSASRAKSMWITDKDPCLENITVKSHVKYREEKEEIEVPNYTDEAGNDCNGNNMIHSYTKGEFFMYDDEISVLENNFGKNSAVRKRGSRSRSREVSPTKQPVKVHSNGVQTEPCEDSPTRRSRHHRRRHRTGNYGDDETPSIIESSNVSPTKAQNECEEPQNVLQTGLIQSLGVQLIDALEVREEDSGQVRERTLVIDENAQNGNISQTGDEDEAAKDNVNAGVEEVVSLPQPEDQEEIESNNREIGSDAGLTPLEENTAASEKIRDETDTQQIDQNDADGIEPKAGTEDRDVKNDAEVIETETKEATEDKEVKNDAEVIEPETKEATEDRDVKNDAEVIETDTKEITEDRDAENDADGIERDTKEATEDKDVNSDVDVIEPKDGTEDRDAENDAEEIEPEPETKEATGDKEVENNLEEAREVDVIRDEENPNNEVVDKQEDAGKQDDLENDYKHEDNDKPKDSAVSDENTAHSDSPEVVELKESAEDVIDSDSDLKEAVHPENQERETVNDESADPHSDNDSKEEPTHSENNDDNSHASADQDPECSEKEDDKVSNTSSDDADSDSKQECAHSDKEENDDTAATSDIDSGETVNKESADLEQNFKELHDSNVSEEADQETERQEDTSDKFIDENENADECLVIQKPHEQAEHDFGTTNSLVITRSPEQVFESSREEKPPILRLSEPENLCISELADESNSDKELNDSVAPQADNAVSSRVQLVICESSVDQNIAGIPENDHKDIQISHFFSAPEEPQEEPKPQTSPSQFTYVASSPRSSRIPVKKRKKKPEIPMIPISEEEILPLNEEVYETATSIHDVIEEEPEEERFETPHRKHRKHRHRSPPVKIRISMQELKDRFLQSDLVDDDNDYQGLKPQRTSRVERVAEKTLMAGGSPDVLGVNDVLRKTVDGITARTSPSLTTRSLRPHAPKLGDVRWL